MGKKILNKEDPGKRVSDEKRRLLRMSEVGERIFTAPQLRKGSKLAESVEKLV